MDETIGGDPTDPGNVSRWDHVRLNLPASNNYDPSLPWVSKVRLDGKVAADRVIFVDDVRTSGNSEQECWDACRKVGQKCSFLGIQDASRKCRKVSQEPGAWAGSVVWVSENEVYVLVSDEKWDKTQRLIGELQNMLEADPERMDRQRLEEVRGFLIYVSRTYRGMGPYLNGLHLTIDGWRPNRGEGGWRNRRYVRPDWTQGTKYEATQEATYRGPKHVKAVP